MPRTRPQTTKIDTVSQNVDANRPHVNGDAAASATDEFENKHISDIVDDLVNSTEVSISGGSDNEAARSDASKTKDEAKSHGRGSSAVKKPASFKAVNVNKTFLNAKSSAPSTQSKTAEKAPATTSSPAPGGTLTSSRPRLVAKTGGGLIAKSSSGASGGKPASVPDPNAVWNKNRRECSTSPPTLSDCLLLEPVADRMDSCSRPGAQEIYRRRTEEVWDPHGFAAPSRRQQGPVQLGRH